MFTLKKIDNRDTELFSELCIETFLQAYEGVHSKHDLDAYCRNNYTVDLIEPLLSSSNTEAIVAFQDAETAGFYVLKHHPCPVELAGKSTELKQIYVLAEHFGSGLGHKLFNSAIDHAQKNNSKWLWLCVSDINNRAKAFYEKIGFSRIGQGSDLLIGNDTLASSVMVVSIESLDVGIKLSE